MCSPARLLPIEGQEDQAGRLAAHEDVVVDEVSVNQRVGYAVADLLQLFPTCGQPFTVGDHGVEGGSIVGTQVRTAHLGNHGREVGAEKPSVVLRIASGKKARCTRLPQPGVKRCEPSCRRRAVGFAARPISRAPGLLEEQPDEATRCFYDRPVVAQHAEGQLRQDPLVDGPLYDGRVAGRALGDDGGLGVASEMEAVDGRPRGFLLQDVDTQGLRSLPSQGPPGSYGRTFVERSRAHTASRSSRTHPARWSERASTAS
jgi:hypothetical protein